MPAKVESTAKKPVSTMMMFASIGALLLAAIFGLWAWNGSSEVSLAKSVKTGTPVNLVGIKNNPVVDAYHNAIANLPAHDTVDGGQGDWVVARGDPESSSDPDPSDSSSDSDSDSSDSSSPRSPSGQLFEYYVDKGRQLIEIMASNPDCGYQSEWTDYQSLTHFGWDRDVELSGSGTGEGRDPRGIGRGVEYMYKSLDVSIAVADIKFSASPKTMFWLIISLDTWINWRHWRSSTPYPPQESVSPRVYKPTEGDYGVIYNAELIVCYDVKSPAFVGQFDDPPITGDALVPLRQLSDVVFLEWAYLYNAVPDVNHLKGFLHAYVTNEDTKWVIEQVLTKHNQELLWWTDGLPKYGPIHFSGDSDEGKALLSTPNGGGLAWFFAQHKWQLGPYRYDAVSIFHNSEYGAPPPDGKVTGMPKYNLLFHVEPTEAWWWAQFGHDEPSAAATT